MSDYEITLSTLAGGAAEEKFQDELLRLIGNIEDPNTDAKAKRSITVKVSFSPNAEREEVATDIEVTAKLAPLTAATTTVFLGREKGVLVAKEWHPDQAKLFDPEDPKKPLKILDRKVGDE